MAVRRSKQSHPPLAHIQWVVDVHVTFYHPIFNFPAVKKILPTFFDPD